MEVKLLAGCGLEHLQDKQHAEDQQKATTKTKPQKNGEDTLT
jgi:hypothetical protein